MKDQSQQGQKINQPPTEIQKTSRVKKSSIALIVSIGILILIVFVGGIIFFIIKGRIDYYIDANSLKKVANEIGYGENDFLALDTNYSAMNYSMLDLLYKTTDSYSFINDEINKLETKNLFYYEPHLVQSYDQIPGVRKTTEKVTQKLDFHSDDPSDRPYETSWHFVWNGNLYYISHYEFKSEDSYWIYNNEPVGKIIVKISIDRYQSRWF